MHFLQCNPSLFNAKLAKLTFDKQTYKKWFMIMGELWLTLEKGLTTHKAAC